jgi:uncharacterized protein YcbK (DUF882 family)
MAWLASCTTAGDPGVQANVPSYASSAAITDQNSTALAAAASEAGGTVADDAAGSTLPQQVAALPSQNPTAAQAAAAPAANALTAAAKPTDAVANAALLTAGQPDQPANAQGAQTANAAAIPVAPATGSKTTAAPATDDSATAAKTAAAKAPAVDPATAGDGSVVTAAAAEAPAPKKQGFLASFFGAGAPAKKPAVMRDGSSAPKPAAVEKPAVEKAEAKPAEIKTARASLALNTSGDDDSGPAFGSGGGNDLPGVRQSALFEIKRRSGIDDDADVDLYEEEAGGPPIQMASAAGMARLAPNGLLRQTESVDVACLKPSLVRALKQIERHYGKKMVVTSGYRSPSHNRRARGAKNSLHMYCAAADIQIPGVGKWELAAYARTMPGRGGVGTYCHTNSIHVDVGPERDWNWRCRGRRK